MKVLSIYERVPSDRSFLSHRLVCDFYPFWWHCHQNYEIFTSLRGGGRYIIGNHTGEFKPLDILVAGPGVPHSFYSLESREKAFEYRKIHFERHSAAKILKDFPEMGMLNGWFAKAGTGIAYHVSGSNELSSMLVEIHRLQEDNHAASLCIFLSLLGKLERTHATTKALDVKYGAREDFNVRRMDMICRFLQDGFAGKITLQEVAEHVNMSIPALCAFFKRSSSTSIIEYVNHLRIEKACSMLLGEDKSISQVAYESGYQTLSHFNSKFKRICGRTPKQFRKEGKPYSFSI